MERPVHKPVRFTRVLVAAGFEVGVSSPGDLWEWREWCGLGCWQWGGKKQSERQMQGLLKPSFGVLRPLSGQHTTRALGPWAWFVNPYKPWELVLGPLPYPRELQFLRVRQ